RLDSTAAARAQPAIESESPCSTSSGGAPSGPRTVKRRAAPLAPAKPEWPPASASLRKSASAKGSRGVVMERGVAASDIGVAQGAALVGGGPHDGPLDDVLDVIGERGDELVGDALLLGA